MKKSIQMVMLSFAIMMVSVQPAFAEEKKGWLDTGLDVLSEVGKEVWDFIGGSAEHASELAGDVVDAAGQGIKRLGKEMSGDSTRVTGNMAIDIQAGDVTSLASGNNSISDIKIGTIGKSQIKDVTINVDVMDVTSVASGVKSKSFIKIGSIENSNLEGTASIKVKANEVASIGSGQESTSSVALGSVY